MEPSSDLELESPSDTMDLSESDIAVLTEARTVFWKIQSYEFAYDYTVRVLGYKQLLFDYTGVVIAVLFLYFQASVPDSQKILQSVLGKVGSLLSLFVIFASIWSAMSEWKAKSRSMQQLSTAAKDLQKSYKKAVAIRPVDQPKVQKWLLDAVEFDEKRKEPLATVSGYAMQLGFQHIGNLHMSRGVVCNVCGKQWSVESNRRAKFTWLPGYGCKTCGV